MTPDSSRAQSLATALRRTRLWRAARDDSVRAAAEVAELVRFERGALLLRRGRTAERLIVLTSGRAEVRVRGVAGTVSAVGMLGAGECVGEKAILAGEPSSAEVVAVDDVEAIALPAADFARIAGADPDLLRQLVRILADRLARTDFAVSVSREQEVRFGQLLLEPSRGETEFAGKSPEARKLRERVAALAPSDAPVLVFGEEGTKRKLVARMVHRGSPRKDGPVLVVDCSEIAGDERGDRLLGSRGEGLVSRTACYLDVAEGGTIVLRKLPLLPAGVQERLAAFLERRAHDPGPAMLGARVVATCDGEPDAAVAQGALLPALREAFRDREIRTPSLRQRKRDIPELATRLLQFHAARLGRPARAFDDEAMTRLVSYDYRFANERELDDAVERAVVLADGETVQAEELFLGPPPTSQPSGIDLLHLPGLDLRRLVTRLPSAARVVAVAAFVAMLYGCFVADSGEDGNLATSLVWSVGWPALALSFLFAGRAACAVCPMGAGATWAARWRNSRRALPAWLKDKGHRVALAGLFLIVLAEQTTGMRHSGLLTGLLFATILTAAVAAGLLFPRRTWCRHLCPLGGLAGVCATSGVLELRPSFDVCSARCTGHACFKGDGHTAGCPMFNHVMFLDGNRDCVLCMDCVRTCPNDSPRLNVRLPARELWSGRTATPEFCTAVLTLGGLVLAMTFLQSAERAATWVPGGWPTWQRVAFVAAVLGAGAALPPLAFRSMLRPSADGDDRGPADLVLRRIAAMTPLVSAGLVAYQLACLPALPGLRAVLADERAGPGSWAAFSVLALLRIGILSAGLLVTAVVLWQVDRSARGDAEPLRERWRRDAGLLGATVGYWGALLGLMLAA